MMAGGQSRCRAKQRSWKDILAYGSLSIRIIWIFLVLIKVDHLTENLFSDLIYGCKLERSDGNLNIAQSSDDWLDFSVIDTI